MIDSISFQNFRKFKEFPQMDLAPITMLVGKNNAGKSTIVKALILANNFLKSTVRYDMDGYGYMLADFNLNAPHVNVMSFKRAFCNDSPEREDTIKFSIGIEGFTFDIFVQGDRIKSSWYDVPLLEIKDNKRNVHFKFNYKTKKMTVNFSSDEKKEMVSLEKDIDYIKERISQAKKELKFVTELEDADFIRSEIFKLERELKSIRNIKAHKNKEVTIELMNYVSENWGNLVIPDLVRGFIEYTKYTGGNKSKNAISIIQDNSVILTTIASELDIILRRNSMEYIYAHSVNSQSTFNILEASNDYFTRTVHEFYRIKRNISQQSSDFLRKWMEEFDIGYDVHVKMISDESYHVLIQNNKDDKEEDYVNLADKGMGAIQMLSLILRLATLIHNHPVGILTILLEEPEQNLHPAFQSKLADMFYELGKMDYQIIVETHSEYLIRRTQVIVAESNYEDDEDLRENNIFKVHYLPTDGNLPYEMHYETTGGFRENFGNGFFDEASELDMIIIRKEFERSKKH